MGRSQIAIIGSGVAGISSAIKLSDSGERVEIYEARKEIGGRFFSFEENDVKEVIDNGQHVMAGAYDYFFGMLEKLGTMDNLYMPSALVVNFYSKDGKRDKLDTSFLKGRAGMLLGLWRMRNISIGSKLRIMRFFLRLGFALVNSRGLTALELLQEEKQGAEAMYWFWEPLILATLNLSSQIASAEVFLQVLKRAFFSSKGRARLIFSTVPFGELLAPFKSWIEKSQVSLHLNASVSKIIIEDFWAKYILLNNGERIDVKAIITTVQPYQLLRIIDEKAIGEKMAEKLRAIDYSSIISVYYWLDRDIIDEDYVALLGTVPQWVFNISKIYSKRKDFRVEDNLRKIAVTISGADEIWELPNEKISEQCWEEICGTLPKAKEAKLLRSKVLRERKATIKANRAIEEIRAELEDFPIKNLIVAGDWTTTGLPATLESAAMSGYFAGVKMLDFLSKKK